MVSRSLGRVMIFFIPIRTRCVIAIKDGLCMGYF
jgi:hypothetical protein